MTCNSLFRKLVSRNDDLRALVEKGYAVTFDSNWLIVRDVPHLDSELVLRWGAIATKLVQVDDARVTQEDHTILFAGPHPCGLDGKPIPLLDAGAHTLSLSDACKDVVVQRRFSNKRKNAGQLENFRDFVDKVEHYVSVISGPAIHLHSVTPLTFQSVEDSPEPSVFKHRDALTAKAEIKELSRKLEDDTVAVIGLGGTGAYLTDFLVKMPLREVRGFDGDAFHVHNAFRSPGRLDEAELGKPKAEVYRDRYSGFRDGLAMYPRYIDKEAGELLKGVTFAFVCVDKGSARSEIFDLLIERRIPFIDVGMGLKRTDASLKGMLRVTYYPPSTAEKIHAMNLAEMHDGPENLYRANVQIAELNALNASLAVIRFKQIRGFYVENVRPYHLLFDLHDMKIAWEEPPNED